VLATSGERAALAAPLVVAVVAHDAVLVVAAVPVIQGGCRGVDRDLCTGPLRGERCDGDVTPLDTRQPELGEPCTAGLLEALAH